MADKDIGGSKLHKQLSIIVQIFQRVPDNAIPYESQKDLLDELEALIAAHDAEKEKQVLAALPEKMTRANRVVTAYYAGLHDGYNEVLDLITTAIKAIYHPNKSKIRSTKGGGIER